MVDRVISLEEYFGIKGKHPDCTQQRRANAVQLMSRVNTLLARAAEDGAYEWEVDPDTGTNISGTRGGAGDGGFRLSTSTTGAPGSAHKEAQAVDIYDPDGALDEWITDEVLQQCGLYREHPAQTMGWCHLQTRAPKSGNRTFYP
jgi:hypothetical protein